MTKPLRPHALIVLSLAALIAATVVPLSAKPARAETEAGRVAYVYNNDIPNRDNFRNLLVSRGFTVDLVTLAAAETFDFSADQAIIIADDTGNSLSPFNWLGSAAAVANIRRAEKYVISVGYGAQYFDQHAGLNIGWGPSWVSSAGSAYAVNPGALAWNAPNPVPIAADTSVKLYGLNTSMLSVYNPEPNSVIRVAREIDDPGQNHYPIAAQPWTGQFGSVCRLQWGFRRAPNAMTPEGRDAFINLVTTPPCGQATTIVDVAIGKQASTDAPIVGQPLTYTLAVVNNSRITAPSVKVVDALPPTTVFVSATPSQGVCSYAAGSVTCDLGDIAGGGSATIVIVVKPTEEGDLLNTAKVSLKALDPNPANNSASAKGSVRQPATFQPIRALPYRAIFTGPIQWLPTEDLSIFGIEVTQGIQCFDTSRGLASCPDNSLSQVTKKDTAARIYLRYNGLAAFRNNVKVRLYITDANNVLYTADATARALPTINRASASDSANIYFNVNFSSNTAVRFYAIVDPDGALSETNESNNRFPASGDISINFSKRKPTMKVIGQRLRYYPSGYAGTQYAGGWAVNGGAADWFEQLLPIQNNAINYVVNSGYKNWTQTMSTDGQHNLITSLNVQWLLQNVFAWLFGSGAYTNARQVYGWVPAGSSLGGHADMPVYPHAGGLGVVAIGNDTPGVSTDNPGSGALIFGHELVHDYNVKHTNTADACGSSDSSTNWPYSNSSIQEYGFNPFTAKVYDPANTQDIMSYCPAGGSTQGWISPFTWQTMFNKFSPSLTAQMPTPVGGPVLAVNATLNNPALAGEGGQFDDLQKVDTDAPNVMPAPGDYSVQLRNAANGVLATYSFTVTFQSEYSTGGPTSDAASPRPAASVAMVVPWVDGAASVVLLHNSIVLDTQSVSANAPVVQITSPNAAAAWPAGSTQTLTWNGSDADGDVLRYSVFYSHNGVDWALLADGLTASSLDVNVDALAGGANARFRVVATDGVLTTDDATNYPITVPNKSPQPIILNPGNESNIPVGDLVVLQGSANDLEDGTLPELTLTWSSDVQGVLGTGASVPVANLQPGYHNITLSATDSAGSTGQTTIRIYVGSRANLPAVVK